MRHSWTLSSAVEHYLHTVGVAGSKPAASTIFTSLLSPFVTRGIEVLRGNLALVNCGDFGRRNPEFVPNPSPASSLVMNDAGELRVRSAGLKQQAELHEISFKEILKSAFMKTLKTTPELKSIVHALSYDTC